jgi:hypothetical protein
LKNEEYCVATAEILYADGKVKFSLNRYDQANDSYNGMISLSKSNLNDSRMGGVMIAKAKLGIVETRQMSTSVMSAFALIDSAE